MHPLSRRQFLKRAGTLTAASLITSFPVAAQPPAPAQPTALPQHPNLLLLITDQERTPQWWPAGWAEDNLPGRKAFADHGITFTHHFCNSAMCSPSRGTLFTGLYAPQHGMTRTLTYGGSASPSEKPLQPQLANLATILATAGYHVVLKGKWHLSKSSTGGPPGNADVAAYGFKEWEHTTVGEANDKADYGGGCADLDAITIEQAVNFLNSPNLPEPFCLIVGLANPHDVLAYPSGMQGETCTDKTYKTTADYNQGISLPPTVNEDLSTKPTCQKECLDLYAMMGTLLTDKKKSDYVNFYAYLHKFVDQQIQTLYNTLRDRQLNGASLLSSTIVVRTADHGEMGLSHGGMRQKMFEAYEESIRVPLVISNPTLFPDPKTNDSWVSLVDLLPTLLSLTHVPRRANYSFSGTDFSPIIANPDSIHTYNDVLYTFDDDQSGLADGLPTWLVSQPNHIRCLRHKDADGVWKFSRYFDPTGQEAEQYEMYHLYAGDGAELDLKEEKNIANPLVTGYNPSKRDELKQLLAQVEAARLKPPTFTYVPVLNR